MTLGELILFLETLNPDATVEDGFSEPHSWRGSYYELAFEPTRLQTVRDMLECARGAVGTTYQGYKGGDFTMSLHSDVYLANYGCCGEPMNSYYFRELARQAKESMPDDV